MTLGGVCLLSGKVRNRSWGVREAEDVGGMEEQELQELVASRCPVSSVRLPNMEERDASREFLRAACPRGPRDTGHGCCDVAGILARETYKKTPESCKTCLPGDTSLMRLKTDDKERGTFGRPYLGSHLDRE